MKKTKLISFLYVMWQNFLLTNVSINRKVLIVGILIVGILKPINYFFFLFDSWYIIS